MMIININAIQINWLEITFTVIILIVSGLLLLYRFVHNPKLQDKLSVIYENTTNLWNKNKLYIPRTKSIKYDELSKLNFFYNRDSNETLYKSQIDLLTDRKLNTIANILNVNMRPIKLLVMWSWLSGCVNTTITDNKISNFIKNWVKLSYLKNYWAFKKALTLLGTKIEICVLNYIIIDVNKKLNEILRNSKLKFDLKNILLFFINKLVYTYSILITWLLTKNEKYSHAIIFNNRLKFKNYETFLIERLYDFAKSNSKNTTNNQNSSSKPLYWSNFKDHSTVNLQKLMPYECGFEVFGDARMLFDVHFYLVSMLFLIFDIEVAYLFPYILCANVVGSIGFKIMLTFLAILTVGLVYEWVKGALNWLQTIYKKTNEKALIEKRKKEILNNFYKEENQIRNSFNITNINKIKNKTINFIELKNLNKTQNTIGLLFMSDLAINKTNDFKSVYNNVANSSTNLNFDLLNLDNFIFHFFTEIIISIAIIITIFLFVYYKSKGFANNIEKQQYIWSSYVVQKTWIITCITLFICLLFYANTWLSTAQQITQILDNFLNYIFIFDKQITKGLIETVILYISHALNTILPDSIIELKLNRLINNFQQFPTTFNEIVISNGIIASLKIAVTGFAFILIYFSLSYQLRIKIWEFNTIFLLFLCFALIALSSNNYFVFFVTIEGMNLCLFVLITLSDKYTSIEVAIKYLILNIISTTALLLGICFTYLATGSLQFDAIELSVIEILNNAAYNPNQLYFIKISLLAILVGMFFKLSIAPFHFWTLDIYEGTSYPILSTLAILIKMTIFGVLLRLLTGPYSFLYYFTDFKNIFFYVGTLSIIVGGILGLLQWTVKRFFAATSINNMGFIIICLSSPTNIETSLYYLFIYNFILMITFAILSNTWLITPNRYDNIHFINSLNGLSSKNIKIGSILTILILSMSGLPPFIIFFTKMSVLLVLFENYSNILTNYSNVLQNIDITFINSNMFYYVGNAIYNSETLIGLMLIAIIITSVIVGYYYIKLVLTMWLNKPSQAFLINFVTTYKNPLKNVSFFEKGDLIGFDIYNLFKKNINKANISKIINRQYALIERELQYNIYNKHTNRLLIAITTTAGLIGFILPLILIIDYGLIDTITIFTFNSNKIATTLLTI